MKAPPTCCSRARATAFERGEAHMPENIVPRELSVDDEFQSLIPPLSYDEYERLEKSIIAEGVRNPIITWNGTIIDGHNRYAICKKHGIGFRTTEREFESRDAAKIWIIENQFGRRNLSKYDRSVLALELEPLYAAEAKRRQQEHGNTAPGKPKSVSQNSDEVIPIRTDEQLAELAGTSRDTIRKVKAIEQAAEAGNPVAVQVRDELRSGEKKSIHGAYVRVAGTKARTKRELIASDGRMICAMCGEPINDGEANPARPTIHKKCEQEYQRDWERDKRKQKNDIQRAYRNPTIGDTNEVLHHDKAELRESLLLVVQDMGGTLQATIGRYETMDVTLKQAEKSRIVKALDALTKAVESIRD